MTASAVPGTRRARRERAAQRRKLTFTGVLGELLLTAGVLVMMFVAWQMWIGDIIIAGQLNERGSETTQAWSEAPAPEPPPLVTEGEGEEQVTYYEPPILPHPEDGQTFATMRIPRFGADYNVDIAGGTTRSGTLDHIGIGVYTQSKMPGEIGNFSVAGHRTTWGKPFNQIDKLKLNDPIIVETAEGWYIYRFRTLEYVTPSEIDVLLDVPQMPAAPADERYITLTACSPLYSLAERIVAYGVFDHFQPRSEGEPAELTEGIV